MAGRIRTGRNVGACRACGSHDISSAPDSCSRCAFENAVETGQAPAIDRTALLGRHWYDVCYEDLTKVVEHYQEGRVPEGRYQVFIDPGDNIPRPMHAADNVQGLFEHRSVAAAENVARACLGIFDSAWIVTFNGMWRVRRT